MLVGHHKQQLWSHYESTMARASQAQGLRPMGWGPLAGGGVGGLLSHYDATMLAGQLAGPLWSHYGPTMVS